MGVNAYGCECVCHHVFYMIHTCYVSHVAHHTCVCVAFNAAVYCTVDERVCSWWRIVTCTHTHSLSLTHTHAHTTSTHTHTHTRTHTHKHTHNTLTYTHKLIHIHTILQTRTHTHTQPGSAGAGGAQPTAAGWASQSTRVSQPRISQVSHLPSPRHRSHCLPRCSC